MGAIVLGVLKSNLFFLLTLKYSFFVQAVFLLQRDHK